MNRELSAKPAYFYLLFVVVLVLPVELLSQTATLSTSEDSLSVGEVFTISLRLQQDQEYDRIIYPDSSFFPQVLEWRNMEQFKLTDFADSVTYRLQFFTNQNLALPPLSVGLVSGTDTSYVYTNPLNLYFKSVLSSENAELKPLKPIFPFEGWPWAAILIITAIIIAAILAYLTLRKKEAPELPPEPVRTEPFVNPADELEQLLLYLKQEYSLAETRNFKYFYTALSDSIRTYFENLYNIPALESTTRELLRYLDAFGVDHEMIKYTRQVLNRSDMVKFAKYTPTLDDAWDCFHIAVDFKDRARLVDASRISRKKSAYETQLSAEATQVKKEVS